MITKVYLLTMLMPSLALASFMLPDNSDFKIQYYNSSTCDNSTSLKNSTFKSICLQTEPEQGYPKCCNSLLQDLGMKNGVKFDTCYPMTAENSSIKGVSYDCQLTKYKGMTKMETFSFIGIILLVVLSITLIMCVVGKCCFNRKGYDRV